ncbi:phosphatase PAP2 family protein [Iodobacter sp. LRB]|uniref:phosphatase PAP2 family protein n=1 Tax=unclassified Iodobacter TaxID=235634 RepID=UPI000C0F32C3|nr:phosphatase PAP2 family protein [Iodobacter sp. BJB302]PHU99792.1 undecaprenyl-diphosphatase [Iodobacter sp. BJB302]
MEHLEAINRALFLTINANLGSPNWLINLTRYIADDLILLIPLLLLGIWFWREDTCRNIALKSCVVTFVALGTNQLIGLAWPHPRPFMLGLGHTFILHAADPSFPSDHLTIFASIGITLFLGKIRTLAVITLLLGLMVGWSRIFLGVHFPLDMLGAVLVCIITYALVTPVWDKLSAPIMQTSIRFYQYLFARAITAGWIKH